MWNRKIILFLILILVAGTAYSMRATRPPVLTNPMTEDQITQLNKFMDDIWNMQYGRYEIDIVPTSKTNANNGEFWFLQTGLTTGKWQVKALDRVLDIGGDGVVTPAVPGGDNGDVQYNDSSLFGGESTFNYDETNNSLTIGNARLHTYGTDNLFIGDNAGNFTNSGALKDIGIGVNALFSLTSGDNNVGIGYNALSNLTTGFSNVGIGYEALSLKTSPYGNVCLGYHSCYEPLSTFQHNVGIGFQAAENAVGSDNIGIGYKALMNSLKASNSDGANIAIGSSAMELFGGDLGSIAIGNSACRECAEGLGNVAIGNSALYSGGYAITNVAIGSDALKNGYGAWGNVAIGWEAQELNSAGDFNVAIGFDSLYTADNVDDNIAIGRRALYNTSDFFDVTDDNVAIGVQAGESNGIGGKNTYIGPYAGYQYATIDGNYITSSNIFYSTAIGYGAQVSENNTVVLGSVDDSTVIGTTAPKNDAKFTLSGTTNNITMQVNGASGQTADLLVLEQFSGADVFKVNVEGFATMTGLYVDGGTTGYGRIILEDSDSAGCTEITTLNGSINSQIVACP